MSQGLKKNRSIEQLGLGWNMLGDAGATSIAECMATTLSIQNLDLRHNHIQSNGAMFLADALRFNEASCEIIDLSFNPLMSEGVSFILRAKKECSVKHWGLQAVLQSSGNNNVNHNRKGNHEHDASNGGRRIVHHRDMTGYYVLHLDHPYDHGVAELLRLRSERNELSEWRSTSLTDSKSWSKKNTNSNGGGKTNQRNQRHQKSQTKKKNSNSSGDSAVSNFIFNGGACEIPFSGVLEFFFIDCKTIEANSINNSPVVYFELNMSLLDDRGIMRTMVRELYSLFMGFICRHPTKLSNFLKQSLTHTDTHSYFFPTTGFS